MQHPDTKEIGPNLKSLIRETGVVRAAGVGCALTLLAFAAPIAVVAWLRGWSWWLGPGFLAGLLLAGLVGLLAVRRIAHRTLVRLADGGAAPDDEDEAPSAPPDPHAVAEAVLRAAWLPGAGLDPDELFKGIAAEDPALCVEAGGIVHDRAVDDLVNGDGPDEVRLTRFVGLVRVVTEGAHRLRGTPAGEPWQQVADDLGRELGELEAALREDSEEPDPGT